MLMFKFKKKKIIEKYYNQTVNEDIIIVSFKRDSREIPDSAPQIDAIFSEFFPCNSSAL